MKRRPPKPIPGAAPPERTVLGLIKELQAGRVSGGGAALPVRDRRRVVEHLWAEGYSVSEIAEVVGAPERTIQRDRQSIRHANALEVHDGLVPEMVGALVRQAEVSISRLRRVSRDRESPAAAKVAAELGCWQVGRELVETMQTLGYLPRAPHELRAAISVDEPAGYAELQRELERVEACVVMEGGAEVRAQITRVKAKLVQLAAPAPASESNPEQPDASPPA